MVDLYKKIIADKGSDKKDTVNNPLSYYLVDNDNSNVEFLSTNVIPMNILMSGKFDGGLPLGRITMMSSPSKYGKTFISLSIIKSAQKKGMSVIVIDTERRFPFKGAQTFGIDTSKEKLMILRENSIEEVKTIILKILDEIPRDERKNILFVIDSWGVLTSSKSMEDGLAGKDIKDMTMSQKKNELANIILNTHATYFICNHVYDSIGGFGDPLAIPGGRRLYFNSSAVILCTSRAKDKDKDKNINGYIISAKAHKGDFCREDVSLEFRIKLQGGLDIFYGLKDDAIDGNFIENSKPGWFIRKHIKDDKPIKEDEMYTTDFWLPIFKQTNFGEYLNKKYEYTGDFDIVRDEKQLDTISNKEDVDVEPDTTIEPPKFDIVSEGGLDDTKPSSKKGKKK
jgi:RecA/RadA recombinase